MEKEKLLKRGDMVILKTTCGFLASESNPLINSQYACIGKVIVSSKGTGWCEVKWDNGEGNSYNSLIGRHLDIASKEYIESIEKRETSYKTKKSICIVTGLMSEILKLYKGNDVSAHNMSLVGYEKFISKVERVYDPSIIEGDNNGIIKSRRTFGVELECTTNYYTSRDIADFLINNHFDIKSDGSVSGIAREYTTPPLRGKAGELALIEACAMLQKVGMTTNRTCGTHCHIGVMEAISSDTTEEIQERVKNLLLFYTLFDDTICDLLPPSRRKNSYARRIGSVINKDHICKLKTDKRFDYFWYGNKDEKQLVNYRGTERSSDNGYTRYTGINFNSLMFRGTVEIRYHQGTLDAPTLLYWIDLQAGIIDYVMDGCITEDMIEKLQSKVSKMGSKEKLDLLLSLIKSKIGNKTPEVIQQRFDTYNAKVYTDPVPEVDEDEDFCNGCECIPCECGDDY